MSRRHDLIIVSQAATELTPCLSARDQKLSRKLLDDASLQEYTCCWHRRGAGGLVEGKEGLGEGLGGWEEEGCAVQVYLAERQPWDMQSSSLQLRAAASQEGRNHLRVNHHPYLAFAFLKKLLHDDCA